MITVLTRQVSYSATHQYVSCTRRHKLISVICVGGPESWANHTIAQGSDIAVASDDSDTEYVYYQLEGGEMTRGVVNPTDKDYDLL